VNLPDTYEQFSGNGNRRKNTNFIGDNMLLAGNLQVTTSGDLEIVVTRDFNAPAPLCGKPCRTRSSFGSGCLDRQDGP
jgi:hypothetical protein